jgi:hypothetical protein
MMIEMSYHLVESIIYSTLTTAVAAPGSASVIVGSLGTPSSALYDGAQIVIDFGTANQEIVTVTNVNEPSLSFMATFTFAHAVGATVIGATFPTQATSGDYFFSQSEILGYLARAQNEFLAQVPCMFSLNTQFVQFGQIYQQLVCDAIEMHRVASSSKYIALTSLTRTGGTVTAVSQSPHGLAQGSKFSIYNSSDPSFTGAFKAGTVIGPDTWLYSQDQPDGSSTDGAAVLWLRLYETSQEELSIQDPFWRNQNLSKLSSWYEDRTGNYKWGVNGKPASQFPVEVLVSQRDTDTLAMTDYFFVPDVLLHAVKYKSLSYCWGKDGEARDPLRQKYSEMRFDRLVLATHRWMDSMIGEQSTKAARRG